MKKKFWGLAAIPLLALLATSCGKEETVETNDGGEKAITFRTNTGKQTLSRASEITTDDLKNAPVVRVKAYNATVANTFYKEFALRYDAGADAVFGAGKWTYNTNTPEFHPSFPLVHFSTYPTEQTYSDVSGSGAKFSYTVNDNVGTPQEDLIAAWAKTTNAAATGAGENDAEANLVYKHALSQVNFAVKGLKNVLITISNISVNGVKNRGEYTFLPSGSPSNPWNAVTGDATYAYTFTTPPSGFTTDGDASEAVVYLGNGGAITNASNALMLMPQAFEGDDGDFTFDYVLRHMDEVTVLAQGSATVEFGSPMLAPNNEWLAGKRYLYTINFEAPFYITYSVNADPWLNGFDASIDVDNNGDGDEDNNGNEFNSSGEVL